MAAVIFYGPQDYRLDERPTPEPGPGEVVAVRPIGGHLRQRPEMLPGRAALLGDGGRAGYCQAPVIPGHEFVGRWWRWAKAPAKVRPAVGDSAVSEQIVPCWHCRFCQRGSIGCAPTATSTASASAPGAMAEYMLCRPCHQLPGAGHPGGAGGVYRAAGLGIHAVQRGEIELGDAVVIAGAGPLGLGMVVVAGLRAGLLIALDLKITGWISPARRRRPAQPRQVDVVDEVLKLTDGYGCDVYIEATGQPRQCCRAWRWSGAGHLRRVQRHARAGHGGLDHHRRPQGINIHGSHLGPYCYPLAIDMLAKGLLPMELDHHAYACHSPIFEAGIKSFIAGLNRSRSHWHRGR